MPNAVTLCFNWKTTWTHLSISTCHLPSNWWFGWIGGLVVQGCFIYLKNEGEQLLLTALGQAPLRTNQNKAAQERRNCTQMLRSCFIKKQRNLQAQIVAFAAAPIADPLIWILSRSLPCLLHRRTGRRCSPEEGMRPIKSWSRVTSQPHTHKQNIMQIHICGMADGTQRHMQFSMWLCRFGKHEANQAEVESKSPKVDYSHFEV